MRIELDESAVERMIGGDTETELRVRETIVVEFTKRHLKTIANDALMSKAVAETKDYINEVVKEQYDIENIATSHLWPTVKFRFESIVEKIMKESCQKAIDEVLLKTIEYQKRYFSEEINKAVKKAMDREIEKEVQERIKQRLEAALKV